MNQSRWCVTAVFAFGALACSDPVPPPAQGAFSVSVTGPAPAGKFCPGIAFTFEAPNATTNVNTDEGPTALEVKNRIIDGESNAGVSCVVKGGDSFTFSGSINYRQTSLSFSNGVIGADRKGTARVALQNGQVLGSGQGLASEVGACTIDASTIANVQSYQVKPGSMWAKFACDAVESAPSNYCRAEGIFVLENCIQD